MTGAGAAPSVPSRPPAHGWLDSHCHVHSMEDPDGVLDRARDAGVAGVVCVGTDLATSEAAVRLAASRPDVAATVGLHPHDASRLDDERDALEALARTPGVVGVGETGFDLHYRHSPLDAQERAFRWQVALARELDLTLVIHTREAWPETLGVLGEIDRPERIVFHCFTGGEEHARAALELGAHLSFSGIVTFPSAEDVRAAAAVAPPDRVLVETDAPYLAPVPYRGRANEPALVGHVGAAVAACRGCSVEALARETAAVTRTVFGLPDAR